MIRKTTNMNWGSIMLVKYLRVYVSHCARHCGCHGERNRWNLLTLVEHRVKNKKKKWQIDCWKLIRIKQKAEGENTGWLKETALDGTFRKGISDKTFKNLFFAILLALSTVPSTLLMLSEYLLNKRMDDTEW